MDRSYRRSIYKVIGPSPTKNPQSLMLEFVSLGADVIERWKDSNAPLDMYQMERKRSEFRRATNNELRESNKARVIYLLRRLLTKLSLQNTNF
jgi:hypothetical protein